MDAFEHETPQDDDIEVSVVQRDKGSPTVSVPSRRHLSRQARFKRLLLTGGALLVAVLFLFGGVPTLRDQVLQFVGGSAGSPPHALGSTALGSANTPSLRPGQGWRLAGPPYASMIAFAPSAPTTAYTCGVLTSNDMQPSPLSIGISHDAGNTWQTLSTPATGVTCDLTVDPTDAQDLVLFTNQCYACSAPFASKIYRTLDGGKHWNSWSLPPLGTNQSPDLLYAQSVWVGATLFIAPYLVGDSGYVRLAASSAREPLVWLNLQGLLASTSTNAQIDQMFATSTELYVEMHSTNCSSTCFWFMQSRDYGASWSLFSPTVRGQPIDLMATGADGRTLLGQIIEHAPSFSREYLRSTDGGATWQALAPVPEKLYADPMYATPDGSVYAVFLPELVNPASAQGTSGTPGIYTLAPGASDWRYVAPTPPRGSFILAWDENGHPIALWGNITYSDLGFGLESHQP